MFTFIANNIALLVCLAGFHWIINPMAKKLGWNTPILNTVMGWFGKGPAK